MSDFQEEIEKTHNKLEEEAKKEKREEKIQAVKDAVKAVPGKIKDGLEVGKDKVLDVVDFISYLTVEPCCNAIKEHLEEKREKKNRLEEAEKQFQEKTTSAYENYLLLAEQSKDKVGTIEDKRVEDEYGMIKGEKIVYTEAGPIICNKLNYCTYTYEGFALVDNKVVYVNLKDSIDYMMGRVLPGQDIRDQYDAADAERGPDYEVHNVSGFVRTEKGKFKRLDEESYRWACSKSFGAAACHISIDKAFKNAIKEFQKNAAETEMAE